LRHFLGGCLWTAHQQEPTQTSAISATTHPRATLVFYYGEVGYWNGIVRIGRFDTTMELIEHQDDNFQVTIERG
jgi:hypothetical protein